MNYIFKTVITIGLLIAFFGLIGVFIPVSINYQIINSFSYWLSYLNYLNPIIHVATLFFCIQILLNFLYGILLFKMFHWIFEKLS